MSEAIFSVAEKAGWSYFETALGNAKIDDKLKEVIVFFAKNSYEMVVFAKKSKTGLTIQIVNDFLIPRTLG